MPRPPTALWGSGLVNESGWVAVDRGTLRTAADGVYAVGDATAIGLGNFFAEPDPAVALRGPNRAGHAGKVLFERHWLARGLERRLATTLGLNSPAKLLGIRARL